jgi:hypothetical protein
MQRTVDAEEGTVPRFLILCLAGLLTMTAAVSAHHSFAAHYFEDQSVTVQGELAEFEYISPHAWVHVMVKESDGEVQKYSAEWNNPNRLGQLNITKDTLKAGDLVVLTGSPGRKATERKIHLKAIERPSDGWKWPARRGQR